VLGRLREVVAQLQDSTAADIDVLKQQLMKKANVEQEQNIKIQQNHEQRAVGNTVFVIWY